MSIPRFPPLILFRLNPLEEMQIFFVAKPVYRRFNFLDLLHATSLNANHARMPDVL